MAEGTQFKTINKCLACDSDNLTTYLDLGNQPLANSFHKNEELASYPLKVNLCKECYHSQLTVAVSPEILYRHYLYVSGTTSTLSEYFAEFAEKCETDFARPGPLKVLDIASNDGSLLKHFKNRGHSTLGVDPAENLLEKSRENGIETIVDFWSHDRSKQMEQKFDVVVAMNVFAHNSDPYDFLMGCNEVLNDNGKIYIQTSQAEIFRNFQFDTIYHEHNSFFTMKSFLAVAKRANLKITHVEKPHVHGKSYLVTLEKEGKTQDSVTKLLETENDWGFYDYSTYENFANQAHLCAEKVNQVLLDHKEKGYRILGYGAAAKGSTFLNFAKINYLEAIIDNNGLKVDLLTPGTNIPVKPKSCLTEDDRPLLILVLAWNFHDEIIEDIKKVRSKPGDLSIAYFPELAVKPIA